MGESRLDCFAHLSHCFPFLQEAMAELAEKLLTKVPDHSRPDAVPPEEQLPPCKAEPVCLEEVQEKSPTALSSVWTRQHSKGKESPSSSAICEYCNLIHDFGTFPVRLHKALSIQYLTNSCQIIITFFPFMSVCQHSEI